VTAEHAALRSATRRLTVLTASAVTLALVVVGALVLAVVLREQHGEGDRALAQAVRDVDDVADQPAGVHVGQRRPDGSLRRSPGAPPWLPVRRDVATVTAAGAPTVVQRTVERAGTSYRLRTQRRADGIVVQAAWSGAAQARETRRLLTAVAVAEVVGLALSVLLGLLLARRAIAPLALAMDRQRRFVADASHELRTPLTLLTTRAQLLERSLRRLPDPGPHTQSEALVDDARRLGDVVSDLLLAATSEAHPQRNERVDLRDVAAAVVAAQASDAGHRGVTLTGPAEGGAAGPAVVLGTPGALRRVVAALVDNALGHVADHGHVTVTVAPDQGTVVLRVADDGPGIDPAVAPRLFERFAQAPAVDGGRTRTGFGIGLALVREVVEAHAGTVSGRDGQDGGAVFEVRLPAAPAPDPTTVVT